MICGFCKSDIDNDSFFCDQCGKELLVCPKCGKTGKGKMCTSDGARMVTAKEAKDNNSNTTMPSAPAPVSSQQTDATKTGTQQTLRAVSTPPPASTHAGQSTITFINKAINLEFSPQPGNIIGRKAGEFSNIFSAYNQISGKHAKIDYSPTNGWTVTDLDSSNGTKYMGKQLQPNVPQQLQDKSYVIFANIEFYVQILGGSNTSNIDEDKTVRI